MSDALILHTSSRLSVASDGWVIHCECGHYLPFDTMTECSKCGAHYEVSLEQIAPPQGT